ncbi:8674_t:CDS:2, partial [Acaulospora morrowiae]
MLPSRQNKVDLDKLTEEEKKLFRLYGKLPTGKNILSHKLKERKYFDSGDYALSKAGKTSSPVGVQHPSPDTIPHANAIAATTHNSSPVKESSLVHEAEIEEKGGDLNTENSKSNDENSSGKQMTTPTKDEQGQSTDITAKTTDN